MPPPTRARALIAARVLIRTLNAQGITGIHDIAFIPRIRDGAKGERITVTGRVIDGAGMALRDALFEMATG